MSNLKSDQSKLALSILPGKFAICRLLPEAPLPRWARGRFVSITRSSEELSVVCEQKHVPPAAICDRDWRCLKVSGPLNLSLVGIMASLTAPLAQTGIAILAISTYDTDYLLVKERDLDAAVRALRDAGFEIRDPTDRGGMALARTKPTP